MQCDILKQKRYSCEVLKEITHTNRCLCIPHNDHRSQPPGKLPHPFIVPRLFKLIMRPLGQVLQRQEKRVAFRLEILPRRLGPRHRMLRRLPLTAESAVLCHLRTQRDCNEFILSLRSPREAGSRNMETMSVADPVWRLFCTEACDNVVQPRCWTLSPQTSVAAVAAALALLGMRHG